MEALRDSGVAEIAALCGGCCACATCHVYIVDRPSLNQAPKGSAEDDLLATSDHRKPNSRLSCQLQLSMEDDGMTVEIAPEN
jgi:ferredoxin, 2Fe-2S